jgi:hypothetical protein
MTGVVVKVTDRIDSADNQKKVLWMPEQPDPVDRPKMMRREVAFIMTLLAFLVGAVVGAEIASSADTSHAPSHSPQTSTVTATATVTVSPAHSP